MHYVIFPGKFDPPHKGHRRVITKLCDEGSQKDGYYRKPIVQLSEKEVYFTLEEKKILFKRMGIHPKICFVSNYPYKPLKLPFIRENDIVEYIISSKDAQRFPFTNDSYLQPSCYEMNTVKDNAYIRIEDTCMFELDGVALQSSTEFRQLFLDSDDHTRWKILKETYTGANIQLYNLFIERLAGGCLKNHSTG